jgi:hypothetical protein
LDDLASGHPDAVDFTMNIAERKDNSRRRQIQLRRQMRMVLERVRGARRDGKRILMLLAGGAAMTGGEAGPPRAAAIKS